MYQDVPCQTLPEFEIKLLKQPSPIVANQQVSGLRL